jgi:hypothetical protein
MIPEKDPPPEMFVTGVPLPPDETSEGFPADLPTQLTAEEAEVGYDMEWAYNDPEVNELYPDKLVAIYHRKVVAVGDDWKTVLEEAERVTGAPGNLIAVVSILGPEFLSS